MFVGLHTPGTSRDVFVGDYTILLQAATGCYRQLQTTEHCYKLLHVATSCYKKKSCYTLLQTGKVTGCYRLRQAATGCH